MRLSYFISLSLCCSLISCSNAQIERIELGNERIEELVGIVKGGSVAVVGNHTSVLQADVSAEPTHLVDTLISRGVDIIKVFAPEHGFRGDRANGAHINDGVDSVTGLPILSLHGKHRKPSSESLAGVDVIIFDIQDVGARFYTYLSTLLLVMEAAAENDVRVIVLDRPNPHGYHVEGPMLDPEFSSFVGLAPVPVIHGMTLGEIALMANGEGWLDGGVKANLTIIECSGYTHSTFYSIPIAPSPNLPSDASISLYPSLCFLEPTNVSIGRGTATPFELVGFPGNEEGESSFTPVSTPGAAPHPKHENITCRGETLDGTGEGWDLGVLENYAEHFRNDNGKLEGFFTSESFFDKLAGTDELRLALEKGDGLRVLEKVWVEEIEKFKIHRTPYLLYPL
jgi:uncharacterized protein YbbC (DUF1343 family)